MRKVCDTRRGEERYGGGKTDSPCTFGHETPELLVDHITRIRRWGMRSVVVKLQQNCDMHYHGYRVHKILIIARQKSYTVLYSEIMIIRYK